MKAMIYDGLNLKEVDYLEDSYDFLRKCIGGYLEHLVVDKNIDMWMDEDGKLKDLDTTIILTRNYTMCDNVVGNVVFTRFNDDGETISLTDDDVKLIRNKFDNDGYYLDLKSGKMIQVLEVV